MAIMAEKKYIDVLNCDDNIVVVPGPNNKSYLFKPGSIEEPFIYPIPPEDVQFINSNCNVFKTGLLRFRKNEQDEIYAELGIKDFNAMFYIEDIDKLILNPSVENLNKIISITDSGLFERIRGRYYWLANRGESVEVRVGQVIDQRYTEIRDGKKKTAIMVNPKEKFHTEGDVQELLDKQKKELDAQYAEKFNALFDKLDKYEKLFEAMTAQVDTTKEQPSATVDEKTASAKKTTRTKKSTNVTTKD